MSTSGVTGENSLAAGESGREPGLNPEL